MRKAVVAIVWLSGLAVAVPVVAPAADANYVDQTVQALQSGTVYLSPSVTDLAPDTQEKLENAIGTNKTGKDDIAVAILPAEAATETGGDVDAFVQRVYELTGHQTVAVAIGSDIEAGSKALPAGLANQYANDAEAHNADVGEAMSEFVSDVKQYTTAPPPGQPGQSGTPVAYILLPVLGFVVGGVALLMLIRRLRAKRREPAPPSVRELLNEVSKVAPQVHDEETQKKLVQARRDTEQLFLRLKRYRSNRIQEITAKYVERLKIVRDTLEKLADIQDHPEYFEPHTQKYLEDGRRAIDQYAVGVLRNVQEVERGELTDFTVNVKILEAVNPQEITLPERSDV